DPVVSGGGSGDLGRHASHHAQSARRADAGGGRGVAARRGGGVMRALLVGIVLLVLAALVAAFAEPLAPTAQVEGLGAALGRGTPLRVTASDRGSGRARVEVRLVPGDGSEPLVLARQEFPRAGILGGGGPDGAR